MQHPRALSRLREADTDEQAAEILCQLAIDAGHEITDEMIVGMIWFGMYVAGRTPDVALTELIATWTRHIIDAAAFAVELTVIEQ